LFCGDAVQCLRTVRGDLKSTNIFLAIPNARNFCARAGASYERQRITSGRQIRPSPQIIKIPLFIGVFLYRIGTLNHYDNIDIYILMMYYG
jgi:hypothetical protein